MNIVPFTFRSSMMFAGGSAKGITGACAIASTLIKRVYDFVAYYFQALQSLGLIGYAAKEILIDYHNLSNRPRSNNEPAFNLHRVEFRKDIFVPKVARHHFKSIQDIKAAHFLGQGILYGASGVLSLAASLDRLNYLALGAALPIFHYGGWGLFLFACLFSLERHIRIYQEAKNMEGASTGEINEKLAKRIKLSAILGMISDISYIFITAFSIFSAGFAFYIIFGCFAIFSIALKNIYDFFFLNMPINPEVML